MNDETGLKIVSLLENILDELRGGRELSEQITKNNEVKAAKMEGEFKGMMGSLFNSVNQRKVVIEERKNEAIINGK